MSSGMARARLLHVCLLVVLSASLAPAGRDWPSGLSPRSGTGRRPRITTVLGPVRVVLTAPER
jgi:hypothetical protein